MNNVEKPTEILQDIGFDKIKTRIVEMPIRCFEALEFTYEGFWREDAGISYSRTLSLIPKNKRIRILKEIVKETIREWIKCGIDEKPKYFEIKATKA